MTCGANAKEQEPLEQILVGDVLPQFSQCATQVTSWRRRWLRGKAMTDTQREKMFRLLQRERKKTLASPQTARESLMRSGAYNEDGSLKPSFGGAKSTAA